MSTGADKPGAPCSDCDRVRIEKQLEADEAVRAADRETSKLQLEKQLDAEEAALAAGRDEEKLRLEKKLDADAAEETLASDLLKSRWETEGALGQLFHQAISDVAKGSVDRVRDSAKFVQIAAGAILPIYTGLLALVFSVTDYPLPLRGIWAGIFLALAIALATGYLAFITKPQGPTLYPGGTSLGQMQINRTGYLVHWINATVWSRRWALRASVLSLLVGVAFIAAPFIATSRPVKVPDAPAFPTIPSQIAAPVTKDAKALFHSQATGYLDAVTARNDAITKASTQAEDAANGEHDLNRISLWFAIGGAILVLFGPLVYGWIRD
jgi:hypothetical protein